VQTRSGRHLNVASDGTLELSADDAEPFIRSGWRKLGEWSDDEPHESEQIAARNKSPGPKFTYARGSLEWHAEQEKERASRLAAEEEKEKKRSARVAAVRANNCQHSSLSGSQIIRIARSDDAARQSS
jgi:hypothetical protein